MKSFVSRRWRNGSILIAVALIFLAVHFLFAISLHRTAVGTGWFLFALLLLLAAYNVRKKIAFCLPAPSWLRFGAGRLSASRAAYFSPGSSAAWLQLHIYAGLLTFLVFGMHVSWRFPDGIYERTLTALYSLVFVSGVFGLLISRVFAKRLTTRGNEMIFERIGPERARTKAEVERLVFECLSLTQSAAVADFYQQRLKAYFDRPRHFWSHLRHVTRGPARLLDEMRQARRFLDDQERQFMDRIAEHVRFKDDLDYHYAHQALLKYWLFAHVPLTYGMLVFAVGHIFLVYAFSGGFR